MSVMHRATCNLWWFAPLFAVLGPRAGERACDVQGSEVQELVQELLQVCSVALASPVTVGHVVHPVCSFGRILLTLLYCLSTLCTKFRSHTLNQQPTVRLD